MQNNKHERLRLRQKEKKKAEMMSTYTRLVWVPAVPLQIYRIIMSTLHLIIARWPSPSPWGGWANDWSCVPPTRVKIRSTRPTNIRLYISYNVLITPQSKTIRTHQCWWIIGWNTKCITSALQTLPYLFQL